MEIGKDKEIQKLNSLLTFYYKEKVKICLRIKYLNSIMVRGFIIKKNFIGMKYVVIKPETKSPIKIFLNDIELQSIIPLDYEKKQKVNNNNRSPVSKALRHKVLMRDRSTCQACGARAPDVQLEVDHIIPVSKGGTDDMQNLTTLCLDCNRGKGDKLIK
jgi:hypothetical protein